MGLKSIPLDLMTITIAAITIGIAVDNSIHYIYRFKEEFKKNNDYNQTVEKSKEVFNKVLSYAIEGNSKAACIMGILYKDGIGCPIDYNKARVWFSFAYTAGSDKAAYSLGYLYLKGLGDVEQDYSKAIEWFEKSNYGMAIHWLSKCYYFGLGVEENKE